CPPKSEIVLNGAANHPKKDLNFDGCVSAALDQGVDPSCVTAENDYPRFDFNGDGFISLDRLARVPLRWDGSAASSPAEAAEMTDLDVLISQWETEPALTEGWRSADLPELMTSGDLEIHTQDLFDAGASEVAIDVVRLDTNAALSTQRLRKELAPGESPADRFIIYTVPAGTVEVRAYSVDGTATVESPPRQVTVRPGEDKRVDLCAARLVLEANRTSIFADGMSTATITATLQTCAGDPTAPNDRPVYFSLQPNGPGHASLGPGVVSTDAMGKASATFTAGNFVGSYNITAIVDLGDGRQVSGQLTLSTIPKLTISYVWQQTILEWWMDGTTRWYTPSSTITPTVPMTDPDDMPDCTDLRIWDPSFPGMEWLALPPSYPYYGPGYCIDQAHVELTPDSLSWPLRRTGTIAGNGHDFSLTERTAEITHDFESTWVTSRADGKQIVIQPDRPPLLELIEAPTIARYDRRRLGLLGDELSRYTAYPLSPSVFAEDLPAEVRLNGLPTVAELGYQYDRSSLQDVMPGPWVDGTTTSFSVPTLELVPRGDGSALQFAADVSQPLVFDRAADGSLQPYSFCGERDVDFTVPPGYMRPMIDEPYDVEADFDTIPGTGTAQLYRYERRTSYLPGDQPMVAGPGRLRVRYAFAATASWGEEPPAPTLPDCTAQQSPVADFAFLPAAPVEGDLVQFSSPAQPATASNGWDFGDGAGSDQPQPSH
ncbi:MAG: hypothetical protein M1337_08845, partial [Actinobacteria bacterium]|nr:hypothetical protein [Actinomycetota bacterium]